MALFVKRCLIVFAAFFLNTEIVKGQCPVIPNYALSICCGQTFNVTPLNNPPSTIVPSGTTYTWTAPVSNPVGAIVGGSAQATGQTQISQTLNCTTSQTATLTYTVTPTAGGCPGAPFTVVVTVTPQPVVPAQTATICSGAAFSVTPLNAPPTSIVPSGTTYTWTAPVSNPVGAITGGSAQATGVTNISQTLTNTTNASATLTYTVTPTSGCSGASFTVTVTVNPTPLVPNQTATICSGTAFTDIPVNNPPTSIVPAGTTYTWTAPVSNPVGAITGGSAQATGQTQISQTLTNTTNAAATLTYTVTPKSGVCAGTPFTLTVTVNPKPVVPAQTATICSDSTFSIIPVNNPPTTLVPSGTTYTWTAPVSNPVGAITGGSAQATGQTQISQTLHSTINTTATLTYTVTPTAGGCPGAPFTVVVTVNTNCPTGIKEPDLESSFDIYPNPATNQLFLKTNEVEIDQVCIFNSTGGLEMVVKSPVINIPISIASLMSGMYIAEVQVKGMVIKKRWMKM